MTETENSTSQASLAFDLLADMILDFLAMQERRRAPQQVRDAVFLLMEFADEQDMELELTAMLLGSNDFRQIA
ncbi:hypothetical protein [Paenibacillus whitsoniae]|uniref:Uncharacterized protein n=1 Tax=Paenibacillus whitsoniae TaxID=2496558 RepID=A0A3R9ZZC2_9BACL|nr:hypothetical protein [Paenibacillus whitsoniae]RTE01751.1 hypothetical protein EJQ19_30800 [Paenibacillus whitsoniae]